MLVARVLALGAVLCSTGTATPCAPPTAGRGSRRDSSGNSTNGMFYVVRCTTVNATLSPDAVLCQATSYSPAALTAMCLAAPGCVGFTLNVDGASSAGGGATGSTLLRQAGPAVRTVTDRGATDL